MTQSLCLDSATPTTWIIAFTDGLMYHVLATSRELQSTMDIFEHFASANYGTEWVDEVVDI
jgi:hypothetical protein